MKRSKAYLDKDIPNRPEEIWKVIKGFEGKYHVSNHGRAKSTAQLSPKILTLTLATAGLSIKLSKKRKGKLVTRHTKLVHTLVAIAFLGKIPLNQVVLHLDKNLLNNHITNLKYGHRDRTNVIKSHKKIAAKRRAKAIILKNGVEVGRICSKCKKIKPLELFGQKLTQCTKCTNPKLKDEGKVLRSKQLRLQGLKLCSTCNTIKFHSEFYNSRAVKFDRKYSMCIPCTLHYKQKYELNTNKKIMINLNKRLSPALKEPIIHLIVTLALKGKKTKAISEILKVADTDISAVIRGMTFGTAGYAKSVYKGLINTTQTNLEFRGKINKQRRRTLQEAYILVGGTIAELTTEMKEKLYRMAGERAIMKVERSEKNAAKKAKKALEKELEEKKEAIGDLNLRRKSKSKGNPNSDLAKKVAKELESNEGDKLDFNMTGDPKTSVIKISSADSDEQRKVISIAVDGMRFIALLTKGSQIIIGNE